MDPFPSRRNDGSRPRRHVPLFELLVAFSLFPAVYVGADRLAPIQALSPVNIYYVAIAGATVASFVAVVRDRRFHPLSAFVLVAAVGFVGWATLSLTWTVGTGEYPVYKLSRMIVFDTLLLWFGLVLAQSRRRIVAFGLVMGLVSAWLALEAIYASQVLGEFAFATVGSDRYLTHGRAIGFAVPVLGYVVFSHQRSAVRLVAALLIVLSVLGSLVAGGRGPFLALVAAIAVFAGIEVVAVFTSRRVDVRRLATTGGVTLSIAASVFVVVHLFDRTPWTLRRLREVVGASETETRLFMIRESLSLWTQQPIVGHGIGSYEVLTATVHEYPHNVVVETLAELGLVGFLVAAAIVLPPLLGSLYVRFHGGDALYSALVALFVFMFVNACLSFDLQSNRQLFFTVGLMALAWTEADRVQRGTWRT